MLFALHVGKSATLLSINNLIGNTVTMLSLNNLAAADRQQVGNFGLFARYPTLLPTMSIRNLLSKTTLPYYGFTIF